MDLMKIYVFFTLVFGLMLTGITSAQNDLDTDIAEQISLTDDDIELFKDKSQKLINSFMDYIVIIGDKSQTPAKRNMAEKEALKLFYEDAIMETSSIKANGEANIRQFPMDKYLYRLKTLPYLRVEIKFYDICYVTEFTRGQDGKYYATATIFQEFSGFNAEGLAYHDVTKKEISIIIDLVEDEFFNEKRWKLFLGDVKVTETRNN